MHSKSQYYVIRKQLNSDFYCIIQIDNRAVSVSNIAKESVEEEFEKLHKLHDLPFEKKKEKCMNKMRVEKGSEEAKQRMKHAREIYHEKVAEENKDIRKLQELVAQQRELKKKKLQQEEAQKIINEIPLKMSYFLRHIEKNKQAMENACKILDIPIPEPTIIQLYL